MWDKLDSLIGHSLDLKTEIKYDEHHIKKKINTTINVYITRLGTYININEIEHVIFKKIKNYFTIKDKTIMGYVKNTNNYMCIDNKIYIPRFGSFILKNKFTNVIHHYLINKNDPIPTLKYEGEFRGNQELIFNEITKKWFNREKMMLGKSGLILNLQAGMGKTFLAMSIIGYLKCRTLIITHNTSILQQWNGILNTYFPKSKIGIYYGKKKTYGDIVVGVINSLVIDDIKDFNSYEDFYKTFDLVIFDEAHEYCSPARSIIYTRCQAPYMLGLSATPNERTDGLDKINHWNIGPILDASKIKGYSEEEIPFTGNVVQVKYLGPDMYTQHLTNEKLEMLSPTLMIEQFTQDIYRTSMIVDLILEHHNKSYNIFVFADRREYLSEIEIKLKNRQNEVICQYLTNEDERKTIEEKQMKEIESIRLVGGSTENDMKIAKEQKNIILSTYQYMATGTSIPKMNCLVLATPRKSKIRQIVGRVFRLGSDYSITRQIIDIVDWKTGLKNQWYKRKAYYNEQEYTIETRKISHYDVNIKK